MTRKQFGQLIKNWRLAEELSQAELAKKANVPQWAVAQLESGRSVGPDKTAAIAKLADLQAPKEWAAERTPAKAKRVSASLRDVDKGEAYKISMGLGQAIDGILDIQKRAGSNADLALQVVNQQRKK